MPTTAPTTPYEIKVRLDGPTAERVRRAASGIGLSPSAVTKVMLTRFGEEGGFPFPVRAPLCPNWSQIPEAKVVDGKLVMPSSWYDEADDDDDER